MADKPEETTTTTKESGEPSTSPTVQPPVVSHWSEPGHEETFDDDDADSALGDNVSSTASLSASILEYRTFHGRRYHAQKTDTDYWGPNDERQADSMDLTHQVITMSLGDKLQLAPIPAQVGKVLDVGTGTGIWAIDFADTHPESEVIGVDLSPTQPTWIPSNVRFEIDDVTNAWTYQPNSFDYIHIRWLLGSIQDWNALFAEAFKATKPGGWVESIEVSVTLNSDDGTVVPGMALHDWGKLFREVGEKTARPLELVDNTTIIPDAAKAAGFTNVEVKKIKVPLSGFAKEDKLRQIGIYNHVATEQGIEGYAMFLLTEVMKWAPEQVQILLAAFRKELRAKKVHAYQTMQVVYGQKPESA